LQKRNKLITCANCKQLKRYWARDLCSRCYVASLRAADRQYYKRGLLDSKQRSQRNRQTLIQLLGGKCACNEPDCWHKGLCGIDDIRLLQFDHILGGGSREDEEMGTPAMYLYYLKHLEEAKRKLQLLCANCNWLKRYRYREFSKVGRPKKMQNTRI